ncbi:uncharacterized protein Eint_100720 [Encephalitozoon intestinalis ATCC 50506]|uniref:Uncharacterized protein n=1 Tax=Encephalitozoon intestinalis (strain ATCC 50506) TaxID=876142 RepID=E0S9L3_ENCIT|nr:uncharacterized protein Eint_100720 [Encephalitozoon intestinalis ATCC 50506]ADM12398.1 hypothetical protein Eint_100720 [Encephalitozoon intestinalis ATCC 50506]UTX46230.1 hypothetical protein GPK93_10g18280 [Encephalitozoon intestinalis]
MSISGPQDIPQEYINNENPFAYMKEYFENPFLDPEIKLRLNALQQMQPRFVPLGINGSVLKAEQAAKTKAIVESQIERLLQEGMSLINSTDPEREAVLKSNANDPRILDILISIGRLKLLSNQEKLREKVYCALKSTIPSDVVESVDYSSPLKEDYLLGAMEYGELEEKSNKTEPLPSPNY